MTKLAETVREGTPVPADKPLATGHWSQDFVEHLRTVHFSLVILAVGLIIVVCTQRDTVARRAKTQLDQIAALVDRLDDEPLKQLCYKVKAQTIASSVFVKNGFVNSNEHYINPNAKGMMVGELPDDCLVVEHDPAATPTEIPFPLETNRALVYTRVNKVLVSEKRPKTLGEFAQLWDALNRNPEVVIPAVLSDKIFFHRADQRPMTYALLDAQPDNAASIKLDLDVRRVTDTESSNTFVYRLESQDEYLPVIKFEHAPLDGVAFFRTLLSDSARETWRAEPFAASFTELQDISKYMQSETFSAWDRALRAEIDRGGDSFEAFGLKVPSQTITLWGTLLLIGVQLYFLTHLTQFGSKLDVTDPGWEVAWVGVYREPLARVLVFTSAVVLPIAAVLVLGFKAIAVANDRTTWLTTASGTLISAVLGVLIALRLPHSIRRRT